MVLNKTVCIVSEIIGFCEQLLNFVENIYFYYQSDLLQPFITRFFTSFDLFLHGQ